MNEKVYSVLFLCDGNSARSILAEAILNHWGRARFRAFSAGIAPLGAVDPLVLEMLEAARVSTKGLTSKSWDEFRAPGAQRMDFVISLCSRSAAELRGALPGNPILAHWTIADPSAAHGDRLQKKSALRRAFRELENRVKLFILVRHEGFAQPASQIEAP